MRIEFWFLQQKEIIDTKRKKLADLECISKSLNRQIAEKTEKVNRYRLVYILLYTMRHMTYLVEANLTKLEELPADPNVVRLIRLLVTTINNSCNLLHSGNFMHII
jgi:hypothetical protein